jgi:hypothetical protein
MWSRSTDVKANILIWITSQSQSSKKILRGVGTWLTHTLYLQSSGIPSPHLSFHCFPPPNHLLYSLTKNIQHIIDQAEQPNSHMQIMAIGHKMYGAVLANANFLYY